VKSGNLNLLEPSGPLQACNGTALPLFIWEQTATCATYCINWLVFITEMKSVYSAVRTGALNKAVCASSLNGCGKHSMELKVNINVQRICITIKYYCIVIVIHALFSSQFFFSCGEIVNFQFSVWICMWIRYRSENGFPLAEHVTCLLASHRAGPIFLSQSYSCALFCTLCVISFNPYLC